MHEFVAKRKKLRVTIEGESVEITAPSMAESEQLEEKLVGLKPAEVFKLYKEFFIQLGIPDNMLKQLDVDDYVELTKFIMAPKKKLAQPI